MEAVMGPCHDGGEIQPGSRLHWQCHGNDCLGRLEHSIAGRLATQVYTDMEFE